MTHNVHDSVLVPHPAGAIVTPAAPDAATEEGTSAVLLLSTEKCTAPNAPALNANGGELVPPTIVVLGSASSWEVPA